MINVRFHGRGGQGVVTSAEILAIACGFENKYAQALPSFGPERTGAPVSSFCRIDEKPINIYQQVYHPDYVVVLDKSLFGKIDITSGLKPNGHVIVNSKSKIDIENISHFIDATKIAYEVIGRPFVNIAMLGALSKVSGLVSIDSIRKACIQRFGEEVGKKNAEAARKCYEVIE